MQNDSNGHPCANESVAELFHLHIPSSELGPFMEKGEQVHQFFAQYEGYEGLEILFLNEEKVTVLVRWNSFEWFDTYLPTILHACPIKNWMEHAQHITHQPGILRSFTISKL